MRLTDFAMNIHSQSGEDGILRELFQVIGTNDPYFVEFGAWDGIHLSNTFALAEAGWSGCYIEGDPKRFNDLKKNVPAPEIQKLRRFVAIEGPDSLDCILESINAPRHLDLLSIDIDSDDLTIWRSLRDFRPRCVVIEYNPSIPNDCEFENPHGMNLGTQRLRSRC